MAPSSSASFEVMSLVGPSILATTTASVSDPGGFDPDNANDSTSITFTVVGLTANELVHGSGGFHDLAAQPGPTAARDFYRIGQAPASSYEVVVDSISGNLGAAGPELQRIGADGNALIQDSDLLGHTNRVLRWENASLSSQDDEILSVRSLGCTTDCTAADAYRIRAYDTTGRIARFNNSASQVSVLLLQNTTATEVVGNAWFWDASGTLVTSELFSVPARGSWVLNTASVPALDGVSGSITITSAAGYGALQGKSVAVEPATGFTFDTPLIPRER
jgi:hypothetical protein